MLFNAVIEKDENGYFAFVPELKGCVSEGESFEEARANIKEAIELYLESLKEIADKYVDKLKIATTDAYKLVGGLSGGNQQKVALAKWLVTQAKLFIFDEPTRGIDVGAKSEIYELMDELVNNGAAILMISSEMSEVIGISDRVYTMNEGEITGCLIRGIDEYTEDNILTYMLKKGGAKS